MSSIQTSHSIGGGILLEAGTNEAEILVFELAGEKFGVNVAKVKEVLHLNGVTGIPNRHPSVEGVVRIRGDVVTLINLAHFLLGASPESAPQAGDHLLLLEFNQQQIAFRVHKVHRIFRVSWQATQPLPSAPGMNSPITSVALIDGQMIQILDFESITNTIVGLGDEPAIENREPMVADRSALGIIFAEDSKTISGMLADHLAEAGFTRAQGFFDGEEAWRYLRDLANTGGREAIREQMSVLVTDVEMPRMDGFTLAKLVRGHEAMAHVPIVIFSSLVSRDNEKKGRQVGVNAQVAKPRYGELISTINQLTAASMAN